MYEEVSEEMPHNDHGERIAQLETHTRYLREDVSEIKDGFISLSQCVAELAKKISSLTVSLESIESHFGRFVGCLIWCVKKLFLMGVCVAFYQIVKDQDTRNYFVGMLQAIL